MPHAQSNAPSPRPRRRFQREQLAVHWREWMTDRTLRLYRSNRVYYALEHDVAGGGGAPVGDDGKGGADDGGGGGDPDPALLLLRDGGGASPERIDNPDQRIAEDVRVARAGRLFFADPPTPSRHADTFSFPGLKIQVRSFTAFSLELFIALATSVIDLVSFSLILYSIQPQLFATIVGYAAFGTVTTAYIGSVSLPCSSVAPIYALFELHLPPGNRRRNPCAG